MCLSLQRNYNKKTLKNMKKLYTLLFIAATSLSFGQVTNGNLETWTDATTPASFSPAPFTANVTQEATIKHGGAFSAKHTTAATGSVKIQNETATVTPGTSYTISYWFLDNDPLARSRPWMYWIDSANATITDTPSESILRPTTYSTDNAQWVQFTATITAPAGAAALRFEMRTYAVGAGLGSVYYDDMSVTPSLGVKENAIAGLKVYPNPVTGGKLFISTDANNEKAVVIFDVLGKQVLNTTATESVNVSNLKGGVYIVKITEDGKTATRKLVIK